MKPVLKKTISVLICLSMLLGVFTVDIFAKNDELKFMVATDTHYYSEEDVDPPNPAMIDEAINKEGILDGELYYHATFQGQMDNESKAVTIAMLEDFAKSDSEYLLIAGDLTCGKRQSHLEFAELLKKTKEKSGKQIFVINGNHDCETQDLDRYIDINEFKEIYSDFGFSSAISLDENSASYTADLSDDYRLLAIDSCIYGESDGKVSDSTLSWIEQQVTTAKADGKKLLQ